jgi:chaperone BCS1
LNASDLQNFANAAADLPNNCIFIIEDIDSNKIVQPREVSTAAKTSDQQTVRISGPFMKGQTGFSTINLADILNAIDGITAPVGRVLILTTNHPEKLDPALLRPGRIDLKVNVGYVTRAAFISFIECFYETALTDKDFDFTGVNVTVATLQNDFLVNKLTLDEMMGKYTKNIEGIIYG